MLNPFKDTNWRPGTVEKRAFARSLIIGFPILAAVFAVVGFWRTGAWPHGMLRLGLGGCGAGVVLWLLPQIARPFYLAWYFIACCVGFVMSNLLFAVFFYAVITPIGLVMRLLGRDPLQKRPGPARPTYWRDVEKPVAAARYFRQY